MILTIDSAEEFRKFADKCESNRFRLYYVRNTNTWMLRPTKSSKNLDTAQFSGEISDKSVKSLETKFERINLAEITFLKE